MCIVILPGIMFSLIQCYDTYFVESFNHELLSYLPKDSFLHKSVRHEDESCCVGLGMTLQIIALVSAPSLLNVDHSHTSVDKVQDLRRLCRTVLSKTIVIVIFASM